MSFYEYDITYQVIETPLSDQMPQQLRQALFHRELHPGKPHYSAAGDARQRMMMVLAMALLVVVLGGATLAPRAQIPEWVENSAIAVPTAVAAPEIVAETAVAPAPTIALSPIFAAPVQHWAPQIIAWAAEHNLDPDIAATIMQIESCGDPRALSHAGASGLFQVMPFHFEPGEDAFDPDTNAFRGLSFYVYVSGLTDGDVGRALAGYNGGPRAALSSWDSWVSETRRYYTWGTGIYADAKAGLTESPTLEQWMQAGGASLCRQAANRLGLN